MPNINYSLSEDLISRYDLLFPGTPRGSRANFEALLSTYEIREQMLAEVQNPNSSELQSKLSEQQSINESLQANYDELVSSNTALQESYDTLQADYNELLSSNTALQENNPAITDDNTQLQGDNPELLQDYRELQERYTGLQLSYNDLVRENQRLTIGNNPNNKPDNTQEYDDKITIPIAHEVKDLLLETSRRLSEKYKKDITPGDILTKMFLRYTVERLTSWFYPFCLTDRDIEDITSIPAREWQRFIDGKS